MQMEMKKCTKFKGRSNKGWKPAAFCGRQKRRKNSRLCGREFMGWITIGLKLSKINRNSSSIDAVLESCSVSEW